jgi:site-specific DNA-methyltransferase (adenine-specific)
MGKIMNEIEKEKLEQYFKEDSYWVERAREIYRDKAFEGSMALQNVRTPMSLCSEIVGKLKEHCELSGKKILILNPEFATILGNEDITYVSDCPKKSKYIRCFYPNIKVEEVDFLKWETDMKFDCVIMNPPYKGSLHLDFLENSMKITKKDGYVISIQPSTWLLSEKTNAQKKYSQVKSTIGNHLKSVRFLNGNSLFNIGSYVPLSINIIDKNNIYETILVETIDGKKYLAKDYDHIPPRMQIQEYRSLKNKILKACNDNLENHRIINEGDFESNSWFVDLSQIRGNANTSSSLTMIKDDFFTFLPRNVTPIQKPQKWMYFKFDSLNMANNFITYCNGYFSRFCLSIFKTNSDLHRGAFLSVPWLDFSQEWTDEKLFKKFKLTEEEIKFIYDVIPKYYE